MKNNRQSKGITLIALVITIIVLLILAGVSISMLTGENGILTQAESADEATKKAEAEEAVDLLLNEWQIERKTKKDASLSQFLTDKVGKEIDKVTQNDADGTFSLEIDGYEIIVTADGKRKEEIAKVEANTEDWIYDEATATITFKGSGGSYVSGNTYDTLVIPNYCNGKPVKKVANVNGYHYYIGLESNIKIKKIIVSEGIEEIGERVFGEVKAEEIILPSTLTSIGDYAFGYNNITEIFIPKSVKTIGKNIFQGCSNLQSINCETELPEGKTVPDGWDSTWIGDSYQVNWGVTR